MGFARWSRQSDGARDAAFSGAFLVSVVEHGLQIVHDVADEKAVFEIERVARRDKSAAIRFFGADFRRNPTDFGDFVQKFGLRKCEASFGNRAARHDAIFETFGQQFGIDQNGFALVIAVAVNVFGVEAVKLGAGVVATVKLLEKSNYELEIDGPREITALVGRQHFQNHAFGAHEAAARALDRVGIFAPCRADFVDRLRIARIGFRHFGGDEHHGSVGQIPIVVEAACELEKLRFFGREKRVVRLETELVNGVVLGCVANRGAKTLRDVEQNAVNVKQNRVYSGQDFEKFLFNEKIGHNKASEGRPKYSAVFFRF